MQKLILLFAGITLFFACQSHQNTGPIKLNHGEKWAVNAEMKPHIEQGINILNDYVAQSGSDYKKLAADLKTQNDQLVKSCTMSGESHDELHKWLHPHMELVGELAAATDPKTAETIIGQLEQSFKTYQNYFK
jgi:hypothetical protein